MKESIHSAPLNDGAKAPDPLVAQSPKSILKKATSLPCPVSTKQADYQRGISWHEEVDTKEEERAVIKAIAEAETQAEEARFLAEDHRTYSRSNNHWSIWHSAALFSGIAAVTSVAYDIYTRKT